MSIVEARLLFTMQKSLQIILHGNAPCAIMRRSRWNTYTHVCVTMGTQWARRKKHHVEHKLSEIFEAL
jgi:hypothetical protein